MNLSKRTTLTKSIALMSLMAAINVVFVLLTTFMPILFLVIVFILPLTSLLVAFYCNKKYFILYALATTGLCLLSTMWNISDTLFYVIPSIISGFLFAVLIETKINKSYIILLTSLVNMAFMYLSIPIIQIIYGLNIIETFINAFGVKDFSSVYNIVPSFIFLLSLLQAIFSFIIITNELGKFNIKLNDDEKYYFISYINLLISLILMLSLMFNYLHVSLLFMMILIYLSIDIFITSFIYKKKWIYITSGVLFFSALLINALTYNYIKGEQSFILISIFFLLPIIPIFINYSFLRKKNKLE